jgi:hypothetical protein
MVRKLWIVHETGLLLTGVLGAFRANPEAPAPGAILDGARSAPGRKARSITTVTDKARAGGLVNERISRFCRLIRLARPAIEPAIPKGFIGHDSLLFASGPGKNLSTPGRILSERALFTEIIRLDPIPVQNDVRHDEDCQNKTEHGMDLLEYLARNRIGNHCGRDKGQKIDCENRVHDP